MAPIAILLLLDAKADRDTQESQICLSATRFLKQIARFGELVFYGNFGTMHRKTQPTFDEAIFFFVEETFDEAMTKVIEAKKDNGSLKKARTSATSTTRPCLVAVCKIFETEFFYI